MKEDILCCQIGPSMADGRRLRYLKEGPEQIAFEVIRSESTMMLMFIADNLGHVAKRPSR